MNIFILLCNGHPGYRIKWPLEREASTGGGKGLEKNNSCSGWGLAWPLLRVVINSAGSKKHCQHFGK